MFCAKCGTGLSDNAAFCSSCGAPQAASAGSVATAPPQAPMPTACPSCGTMVAPGRSFCTNCGHSMTGAAPARAPAARAGLGSLDTAEMLIAGAFAVALIGTLLEWISFGPEGVSGWNTDSRFRIAEWLGVTAPIDAAVIVGAAGTGAFFLLGSKFGFQVPSLPFAPAAAGAVIAAVGVLEWVYIDDIGQGQIDPGIGLYAVIVAGVVATAARFLTGLKLS